jgi:4-hydroxythreonine-4-phosphate dehydrogenase
VAFDIAGNNKADEASFRQAIFTCIDIINQRFAHADNRSNKLKKMSAAVVGRAVDQRVTDLPE